MTEPPASSSGTTYQTVDARCAACEIYGGLEAPCIPDERIDQYLDLEGRPCAREDLDADNALPYELLHWLVNENLRPLAPAFWADGTVSLDADGRLTALRRVCGVLTDPKVLDILYPHRKADDGRTPSH